MYIRKIGILVAAALLSWMFAASASAGGDCTTDICQRFQQLQAGGGYATATPAVQVRTPAPHTAAAVTVAQNDYYMCGWVVSEVATAVILYAGSTRDGTILHEEPLNPSAWVEYWGARNHVAYWLCFPAHVVANYDTVFLCGVNGGQVFYRGRSLTEWERIRQLSTAQAIWIGTPGQAP